MANVGFTLDKPGHRPGPNAIRVLADVRRRGPPDSWPWPRLQQRRTRDLQLPARALGYRLVLDYRTDQPGIQPGHSGAVMIEGTWYRPALPHPLIDATIGLHAQRIDGATWAGHIAARAPFRLMATQRPDTEGHQRLMCPAGAGNSNAR
ncbi:hypothetical protein [Streptomyces caatingaensis]|uniref:Uncharacterized protein n=1 Tax=Streptomyces caatingaensis TaxID=1678637 RepID=A0A0K9X798_9ACTN|nr:hypothetical protein [Streptomyces caatingaensis]KNB49310.1 hypothetical protein AC230_28965 [Streptomyces caatingaensis]